MQTGGQIGHAYFAYGSAPGRQAITIAFDGQLHTTPVNSFGIWAFIKIRSRPHSHGYPTPET